MSVLRLRISQLKQDYEELNRCSEQLKTCVERVSDLLYAVTWFCEDFEKERNKIVDKAEALDLIKAIHDDESLSEIVRDIEVSEVLEGLE